MDKLIEAGKIVNTHGIRGEVRIQPWCDSPEFLADFDTLYLDGKPIHAESRAHKTLVLSALEGVNDVQAASALVGRVVSISRADTELPEGSHFIADLIGLEARSNGAPFGVVTDVLTPPAHDVYEITGQNGKKYLIPAVREFVLDLNPAGGFIEFKLIEGFEQ